MPITSGNLILLYIDDADYDNHLLFFIAIVRWHKLSHVDTRKILNIRICTHSILFFNIQLYTPSTRDISTAINDILLAALDSLLWEAYDSDSLFKYNIGHQVKDICLASIALAGLNICILRSWIGPAILQRWLISRVSNKEHQGEKMSLKTWIECRQEARIECTWQLIVAKW